jgi:hypothetical protein
MPKEFRLCKSAAVLAFSVDRQQGGGAMRRRRTRLAVAAVAAALLLLAGGWYWGSPWWTLSRMREAARSGDSSQLAAFVDFAEISRRHRRDYRMWMRSVLETVGADNPHENARSFRAYAARALARPDSDIFIAEADIRPWLADMELRPIAFGRERMELYVLRHGLDRFEVREVDGDWEMGPMLSFRREGLGWRLAEVRWGQQ